MLVVQYARFSAHWGISQQIVKDGGKPGNEPSLGT